MGPPLRGNFGPGRCDGHRSHETAPVPSEPNGAVKNRRRGGTLARPSSAEDRFSCHFVGEGPCPSRRFSERPRPAHLRSRTLCHGWSEPGAAVKWHRPKFCTTPGPSGPGGIIPGTIFCAPEILRKGIGVSPVNGGLGENELEPEGTCFRRRCESPPGDPLVSFPSLGKKLAQRAKPSAWNETRPETGGRVRRPAPTVFQADHSRTGQREGQAPPLQGGWGDIPWRRTGGRLSELFSLTINFAPQGEPLHPKFVVRVSSFYIP